MQPMVSVYQTRKNAWEIAINGEVRYRVDGEVLRSVRPLPSRAVGATLVDIMDLPKIPRGQLTRDLAMAHSDAGVEFE